MNRLVGLLPGAAVVILGLAGCSLVEEQSDPQAERLYGRTWIAELLGGEPVPSGVESSLTVASDGKVSGHAGCNGYFGSVIIAGDAMSFGNLGSTRMACAEPAMSQEGRLLEALDSTRGYRLQDGDLVLLDGAGTALGRFHDSEADA